MKKAYKMIINIVGVIAGLIILLYGLTSLSPNSGSYIRSNIYGGDAYTGIQNAAADTGNNVRIVGNDIIKGIGMLEIGMGLFISLYSGNQLVECFDDNVNIEKHVKQVEKPIEKKQEEKPIKKEEIVETKVVEETPIEKEIKEYKELLDMGAITQEEFDLKKKQIEGK